MGNDFTWFFRALQPTRSAGLPHFWRDGFQPGITRGGQLSFFMLLKLIIKFTLSRLKALGNIAKVAVIRRQKIASKAGLVRFSRKHRTEFHCTVNSRYSGHPRDHDLVSVIARVRNSGVRENFYFKPYLQKGVTGVFIFINSSTFSHPLSHAKSVRTLFTNRRT